MSERVPAQITIGGEVSLLQASSICEFIISESLSFEWGEYLDAVAVIDLIHNVEKNGCLILRDNISHGSFEKFEIWLRKENIAFDCHCDAGYESDSTIMVFRPGVIDTTFLSTQNGDRLIHYNHVNDIRKYICEDNDPSPRKLDTVLQMITELLGPEIPELLPFKITE